MLNRRQLLHEPVLPIVGTEEWRVAFACCTERGFHGWFYRAHIGEAAFRQCVTCGEMRDGWDDDAEPS